MDDLAIGILVAVVLVGGVLWFVNRVHRPEGGDEADH